MQKKKKSLSRVMLFTCLLWFVVYTTCFLIVKELSPNKITGILLSFLPAVTFAVFLFYFIKGISEMDELERRIQLEATVIAFSLSLLLLMTLGLLDLVIVLKKEDWGHRHLIPYFATFYFAGIYFSRRKYL